MRSTTEPMEINTVEAPGQPQHRRGDIDCDNSKSTKLVVCSLFVGIVFGIFVVIRINFMGCGCPEPFSSNSEADNPESSSCDCNGDVFSCKYTCPGGQLYCGQELCPGQQLVNASCASGGGGGADISTNGQTHPACTVMCPGFADGEYCNCVQTSGGDCVEQATTTCNCAEAKAANCCNSSSG